MLMASARKGKRGSPVGRALRHYRCLARRTDAGTSVEASGGGNGRSRDHQRQTIGDTEQGNENGGLL